MNEPSTLPALATSESLNKINNDWSRLIEAGQKISDSKIFFVNLGREIGLTLIGLCGHEQMRLSFFENIKDELPATLTFSAVQKCIHLAHALPQPVATIEEANRAEIQLQLALGISEKPHREQAQISQEKSTSLMIFETLATAKDRLLKEFKNAGTWDENTKESIRQQVQSFRRALAEIEEKL